MKRLGAIVATVIIVLVAVLVVGLLLLAIRAVYGAIA